MSEIGSGVRGETQLLNLKEISISQTRKEVLDFLVSGEEIEAAFSTIRDQVVFTNKRIIVVNVQGMTGKKVSYFSYPFSKVQYFAVETAGVIDLDSELNLYFNNGNVLHLEFKCRVNIRKICSFISNKVL